MLSGETVLPIYFVLLFGAPASQKIFQDSIQLERWLSAFCMLLSALQLPVIAVVIEEAQYFCKFGYKSIVASWQKGSSPLIQQQEIQHRNCLFLLLAASRTNPFWNFLSFCCWPFKSDKQLHTWVAISQTAATCSMFFHWKSTDRSFLLLLSRAMVCLLATFLYRWKAKLTARVFLKASKQAKEENLLILLNLQLDSILYFKVRIPWSSEKLQCCMSLMYDNLVHYNYYCLF